MEIKASFWMKAVQIMETVTDLSAPGLSLCPDHFTDLYRQVIACLYFHELIVELTVDY